MRHARCWKGLINGNEGTNIFSGPLESSLRHSDLPPRPHRQRAEDHSRRARQRPQGSQRHALTRAARSTAAPDRLAFKSRSAVHHRHAREADIVLEYDRFASELAGGRPLHCCLDVWLCASPIDGTRVSFSAALRKVSDGAGITHSRFVDP
jgi:hypothetical protein